MCNKHYLQVRRRERAALAVPCSVGDCDGVVYCSGLCATHYRRWRAYGSTDERRIPNPDHLRWGTPQENTDDMVAKGRDRFSV